LEIDVLEIALSFKRQRKENRMADERIDDEIPQML